MIGRRRYIMSSKGYDDIDINNYLTIVAEEDGLNVSLSVNECEYCINGNDKWLTLPAGTKTLSINTGQTLSFKGLLVPTSSAGIGTFTVNKKYKLKGNIMSLLFGDNTSESTDLTGYNYAFYKLFNNNTKLIDASELSLPATTLSNYCYYEMFMGCSNLTTPPVLPATTLTPHCYNEMFSGCSKLTTAPELKAEILTENCYSWMFYGTGLTEAPELPAMTLAVRCYNGMFASCSKLTKAPELPATLLVNDCYPHMFYYCTSLTTAPELPAVVLKSSCYTSMFQGCSKLNYIKMTATDISAYNCLTNWVYGVASTGTFVKHFLTEIPTATSSNSYAGIPSGWLPAENIEPKDCYFTIVNTSGSDNTITFIAGTSGEAISYSINGDVWTSNNSISLPANGSVRIKGTLTPTSTNGIGKFSSTGNYKVYGNIMSLIYGDDFKEQIDLTGYNYAFYKLFYNCNSIIDASNLILPATTLAYGCYSNMFNGCTGLTEVPALPAPTLVEYCYSYMFQSCTGLNTIPDNFLPATTLATKCYSYMFAGCTGLTTIPNNLLKVNTLATYCYQYMFSNCTNLTTVPDNLLPANSLTSYCYRGMFYNCEKLTKAPVLSATTLASYCYYSMFNGCTELTQAPELNVKTLAEACYSTMFYNCSKLNYIKMLATDISATDCLTNWVYNVADTGTFVKQANTYLPIGNNGIPEGWNVIETDYEKSYFTIEALATGVTVKLSRNACEYRLVGESDWTTLTANTTTPSIANGEKIQIKILEPNVGSGSGIGTFTISGNCNVSGNIMSLLWGDNFEDINELPEYAFYRLFYNNTQIISAENLILPATELSEACYFDMFLQCTGLTTAPELPATTLAPACYYEMFRRCTSLISAPELPAATLVNSCYAYMFENCSMLNYIKMLATDISATNCLYYWVRYVAYTGVFVKHLDMKSLPTGNNGIPVGWTVINESEADFDCYFTIKNLENTINTITFTPGTENETISYSIDGNTWVVNNYIEIPANGIVQIKGSLTPVSFEGIGTFSATGNYEVYGNIMSLLYDDDFADKFTLTGKSYAFYKLFYNNTKLISAKNLILPAVILVGGCYAYMFYGCSGLTEAPELPATILTTQCYYSMFHGCKKLTTAPELPATTLSGSCYAYMFYGCSGLTEAPELPATTLSSGCYSNMFYGTNILPDCSNIDFTKHNNGGLKGLFAGTNVTDTDLYAILPKNPDTGKYWLPATTLTSNCYEYMFNGCTGLTQAPELPATTLANYCYYNMFYYCTNLTKAPELPADKLANNCYRYMFNNCSKLNSIKMLATDISADGCLYNWVKGVASTGTFVKHFLTEIPTATSSNSYAGIPSGWTVENIDPKDCYFTIVDTSGAANTITFTAGTTGETISYSINGDVWTSSNSISLPANGSVRIKGTLTPTSTNGIGTFSAIGNYNVYGNIMSLLYGDSFADENSLSGNSSAFSYLFKSSTNLINANKLILPAMTLSGYCYREMFSGCTGLTEAPALPATSLTNAGACYYAMFSGCTGLTEAPALPATTLSANCYQYMFNGCTGLTTLPDNFLPATTLTSYCYAYMFNGCTGLTATPGLTATSLKDNCYKAMFTSCTGLTTLPDNFLPATTLASSCYSNMFEGCTGLTTIPNNLLKANTLATFCYQYMFNGCTNLATVLELPAKTLYNYCYRGMFYNCKKLTAAPVLSATTLANYCYYAMFCGCTGLTQAPELNVETLTTGCYQYMFEGCSKLNSIQMLATDISATDCLNNWVSGVSNTGTFYKYFATDIPIGVSGIPSGWTVSEEGGLDCYFTIENDVADNTITFKPTNSANILSYSINGGAWTSGNTINIPGNGKARIKATITPTASGIGTFSSTLAYSVYGNILSLLLGDNFVGQITLNNSYTYAFYRLFYNSKFLADANKLILPSNTTKYCYWDMFRDCTNLMSAPDINVTTLQGEYCCYNMFRGCTNLANPPKLNILAISSSSKGACYGMFYGCTSLTAAPKLLATTLAEQCYSSMFYNCSKLTEVHSFPTNVKLAISCCTHMFYGCTSLTAAPALPATTLTNSCYSSMFSGCTSLTTAPTLSATTLTEKCYSFMFKDCSKLNYIKMLGTNISATDCLKNWVSGVSSTGTFVKNSSASLPSATSDNNYAGIPSGWSVINAS